jgi:RNA polymerase sigma factor (sigma-70 family)
MTEEEFTAVYTKNYKKIRSLAYFMTRNDHDAEDIVTKVFIELYNQRNDSNIRDMAAILFNRCKNRSLDCIKHREVIERLGIGVLPDNLDEVLVYDTSPSPESSLITWQRDETVKQYISRLPRLQRNCLSLRLEGLSLKEIGKKVGCSEKRVWEANKRALANLTKLVKSEVGSG